MGAASGERSGASRRRRLLVGGLLALTLADLAGVVVHVRLTGTLDLTFLAWNLFLAWLPLALAIAVYDRDRDGATLGRLAPIGVLWLLFLPNAPYIVTDLKWVDGGGRWFWFDAVLIGGAATIGLALGFVSLYLVQTVACRRFGPIAGWGLAWTALALSGVGVYLGRFERWNSWDVFTEPTKILGDVASAALDPLAHGRPLALAMFFAVAWWAGYALFYTAFRRQLQRLVAR